MNRLCFHQAVDISGSRFYGYMLVLAILFMRYTNYVTKVFGVKSRFRRNVGNFLFNSNFTFDSVQGYHIYLKFTAFFWANDEPTAVVLFKVLGMKYYLLRLIAIRCVGECRYFLVLDVSVELRKKVNILEILLVSRSDENIALSDLTFSVSKLLRAAKE